MMNVVVEYYAWIVALLSVYFLIFALTNAFWLWIYSKKAGIFQGPKVSVCIPARNEEKNIEGCIRSFMAQSYENYEVLVLNDNSEDRTADILDSLEKEFPGKLRVFNGKPLEEGWTGKIFAMNQLIQHADGEYLLFSDADTIHGKDSIAFAVTNLTVHNADMLSGYIKEKLVTFGERITIPLMFMLTGFVLPMFLNRITPFPFTSVAIGQYIMIKKNVFEAVGGYESMKNLISEDVFLARLVKKRGYKTIFTDCKRAATCRMYTGYGESVNGITKNIFSFLSNNTAIILAAIFGVSCFLLLPFPLFIGALIANITVGGWITTITVLLGINVLLMFIVWVLVSGSQHLPFSTPFLYPVLFGNLVYMATLSYIRTVSGKGYVWKGRVVH
ncbi:MAG: glycosyltransferase [Spirochaetaceae bacterium]|nr:glycosyltransferase [Spirochaetaceae bacterium]